MIYTGDIQPAENWECASIPNKHVTEAISRSMNFMMLLFSLFNGSLKIIFMVINTYTCT